MPPVTSMASMHKPSEHANVARNAWKVPLDIYDLTSHGSILNIHYLHPKDFIKIYLAQKRPITHCCFGANNAEKAESFLVSSYTTLPIKHLHWDCLWARSHPFWKSHSRIQQRFDLRTSDIFCRAIPFTIPKWFLNGHVFHVAVIGSITVSASMDWDPSHILKNSNVEKLALCLWCAGLTEC